MRAVSTYLLALPGRFRPMGRVSVALGFAIAFGILPGCATTHSEYLAALNSDPLADVTLPGASREDRTEVDAREGGFMDSKRTNAKILQVFRIDDSANPDDVLAAAGDLAHENGWIIDSTRASGITAHKTLSTGRAELGIAFMPGDDVQKIVVNLTASWQ